MTCAIVDLPGQGESTSGEHEWSLSDFGNAVAAVIRQRQWPRVVTVGHSMGGAVAVEVAHALPDVVERVICVTP